MEVLKLLLIFITIRSSSENEEEGFVGRFQLENQAKSSSSAHSFQKPEDWRTVISGMDCASDDIEKHYELSFAYEMLKKGKEEMMKRGDNFAQNTTLVLGKPGTGKTTFSQFMAGDNNKLLSMEVGNDTGEFLIVDGLKIGTSPIESQTLYPEEVKNSILNVTYTDTPGFSDTRSSSHELVATYVMKQYLDHVKNIKIVLLIHYNSVQYGSYKDDFTDLLRSMHMFINDIDKYKDSIVLIANKVPNSYKITKGKFTLIPDRNIIISIAEFLNEVKVSINEKLPTVSESEDKEFLQNAIKIIECLEEVDELGNYKKINIFRRPSESGSLASMKHLQEKKLSIQKMIDNVNFTEISKSTVGYSLSTKTNMYLNCLLQYINEQIDDIYSNMFQFFYQHYKLKTNNYTDIFELSNDEHDSIKKLEILKNDLEGSKNYKNFVSILKNFVLNENIQPITINKNNFSEIEEYVNVFQQFTRDNSKQLNPLVWTEHLKPVISNLKSNILWYDGLIESFKKLSSYESQKSRRILYDARSINYLDNPFKLIYLDSNRNVNKSYFDEDNFRERRKNLFDELKEMTLTKENFLTCNANGKLITIGYFVKISSVIHNETLRMNCQQNSVKTIVINAYTVFIDSDITGPEFEGITILIFAIKWEVIGQRKFIIDGKKGKSHEEIKASDGTEYGEKGINGKPGLPGGSGGTFVGVGLSYTNLENLLVSAQGGQGGPGQLGGDGAKGKPGKNGYDKFVNDFDESEYNYTLNNGYSSFPDAIHLLKTNYGFNTYCKGNINVYYREGSCGGIGGEGGKAGVGGIGGNSGEVLVIGKEDLILKMSVIKSNGTSGISGKKGKTGLPGVKGFNTFCYRLDNSECCRFDSLYICGNGTDSDTICADSNFKPYILNSDDSITMEGIEEPEMYKIYNFLDDYNYFEKLLGIFQDNMFLSNDISKFEQINYKKYLLEFLEKF